MSISWFSRKTTAAKALLGRIGAWATAMVATAMLAAAPMGAVAQTYPSEPITIIVAYSPGGATDVLARMLAERLTEKLGQQVAVENRPGASGMIGAQAVATAEPDGHTLLIAGANEAALNMVLFESMPYDPRTELEPVSLLVVAPVVLVANVDTDIESFEDLLEAARAGEQLGFGSVSVGSPNHIAGELLNIVADIDLNHVPYPGAGPAMTAVLGGHIPLAFLSMASALPQIEAGELRALAVTTDERFEGLPDLPTIAEHGFEEFNLSQWYAMFAPAGTPNEIIETLNSTMVEIVNDPDFRSRIVSQGGIPVGSTPEELGEHVESEIQKYEELAPRAGVEPQ